MIEKFFEGLNEEESIEMANSLIKEIYKFLPKDKKIDYPCMGPILVPADKVVANDYNPNKVAAPEMKLLQHSIEEDGLTMGIVVFHDKISDNYIVVDGFHRTSVLKKEGMKYIPVVQIDKDIKDRMASTVRHNRARGVHKVDLQAEMVVDLVKKGWTDAEISKHLGMSFEEVLRLKQVTGVKEIFKNRTFSRSWIVEGSDEKSNNI